MLAHYGVDVLDPRTTLRRVHLLVSRLPPGTWPQPDQAMSWTNESHLLATVIDALALQTFELLRVWGAKPKAPKPFYRPSGSPGAPPNRPRTAAARSGPARAPRAYGPEPVKTSGWGEFARILIGQPGIRVEQIDG